MDKVEKESITKRYQERLKIHGEGVKALSSGNTSRQHTRFLNLCQIGSLENKTILDFGCGLADFYEFLKVEMKINVHYCGVDIVPEFIDIASKKFPEARFTTEDILETDFLDKNKFDFIFCSQVFNNRYANSNNMEFAANAMLKLNASCNEGLAMDFITSYVDFEEPHLFYYSPEKMYSIAKKLTKSVVLKSDYPLFEFMLFIYKDFPGWSKSKN
jgi:SAM-dependent methyltransferase